MDKTTFKELSAAIISSPALRWVDFDLGQLEVENPPVSYPCALIRLDGGIAIDTAGALQNVELAFTVRVAFKLFERTHSVAATAYRDAALAHLDTLADVHAKLQGLSGTNFGAISRVGYWTSEPRADIRVYSATYQTLLEDAGDGGDPDENPPQYIPWADIPTAAPELCMKLNYFASLHGIEIDWEIEGEGGVIQ